LKVFLSPTFRGVDKGDGGVRRVVEAQARHLPAYGWEVVSKIEEADVVACHIGVPDDVQKRLGDRPLAVHNHGLYWAEFEWAEWCYKANAACLAAIRQADAVTAPSDWVAQSLRRASLRAVGVIGHGVDLEDWQPEENKGYVLWNKTRPDPVCDPAAAMELARRVPEVKFLSTFGDDKLPNVVLTERLPYDLAAEAVRRAGVYLCTTKETFGIGTLEAMAAGVPVLGWRWGGQVDIVDHKETGWLAEPGDYDSLEEGLWFCLKNREALGRRAQLVVAERYQWKDVVGRYAQLYERLISARGAVENGSRSGPRVSVIVPAYNLGKYLPEALKSVTDQTLRDWECVVVDDASPDSCGEIAESYASADGRFKVIHNEKNQYLAGALNTGIAASTGRYVLALDADNRLPPDALQLLTEALDKNSTLHIAYGNVLFVREDGSPDESVGGGGHSGWPMSFRTDWQLVRRNGERPSNLVPSSAMYRREVWECTGGYRRRYRTAEDADFWTRATSYGFRAAMVTEADCLVYRNRESSMSRQEKLKDWTLWYPWCRGETFPPAAVDSPRVSPVSAYDFPEVAVIIPVGPAHRDLVVDALDSVDAQTFRNWECVVVNDSGESLRWTPSWSRVIETLGQEGVAAARNRGLRESRAKLFVPLDADDVLEPEALAEMLKTYRRFGGYVYSDFHEQWKGRPVSVWKAPDYDAKLLLEKGCLHAVTGLYEKEIWEKVGGFDEKLPAWEDWDFQLRLAEIGVCGTRIPKPLFVYRKETGLRRDENYANFEESKQGILAKWRPYFEGGKTLMGCRACPGGGGGFVSPDPPPQAVTAPPNGSSGYVLVEYVGGREGIMTYRAPSGTLYNFSALATERQKYVRQDDATYFSTRSDFVLRSMSAPEEVTV